MFDEGWRKYTIETEVEPIVVVCRDHGSCEVGLVQKGGRFLTLGAVVEWARAHEAAHGRLDDVHRKAQESERANGRGSDE